MIVLLCQGCLGLSREVAGCRDEQPRMQQELFACSIYANAWETMQTFTSESNIITKRFMEMNHIYYAYCINRARNISDRN